MDAAAVKALIVSATHVQAAKNCMLAGYSMMAYDVLLTFSDEVERIWKKRFSFLTVLWFLNRWVYGAAYIVVIIGFYDPNWVS
ncbi:hypothetical protein PNOK_0408000 [Pyrrhoderma noxium]|uniref:DUF6533 domain-containing protein n=1 Tax=Pyrrhoderma noxium TaxID=2282107 RepID=A0A286UPD4_9AGAM|nr:hypothetical protein PNOK_0408000 [Pyrrhoderma noxium]